MAVTTRPRFEFGDVSLGGKSVRLTWTQYRVLQQLINDMPNGVRTKDLHKIIYGEKLLPKDARVRIHVRELRRRLRESGIGIEIVSRYGFGYKALLH